MPNLKDLAEALARVPADASPEEKYAAVKQQLQPGAMDKAWGLANRPLVGSKDSPLLAHAHGADEGVIRRTAEDFGSSLTSPLNLALAGTGALAGKAAEAGMMGISKGARLAEAGLQAPLVAEGLHGVVEGDTAGEKLGGAAEAALGFHGLKRAATHAFDPQAVKSAYMAEHNLQPHAREAYSPQEAIKTGADYQALEHTPNEPQTQASYAELTKQIDAQHAFLRDRAGVKLEPWTGEGEPYASSAAMQKDVKDNNHLFTLPTAPESLPSDHPMQGGANDKFRAVHDYFGHATEGNQFGPKGEQAAYNAHRDTLSPGAHAALATETKGQNSWVNAGPHILDEQGQIPKKGDAKFVAPQDRPFAQQKAGILPEFQRDPSAIQPQGDEAVRGVLPPGAPDIHQILQGSKPFGILSAGNPHGQILSAAENLQRHQALLAELKVMGHPALEQQGVYGGAPEPSVLVPGLPSKLAQDLGRKYQQESVITHEGWHRLADGKTFPRTGIAFDPQADNFYSEVARPGQAPLKYQMAFPDAAYEPASPSTTETHTGVEPPVGGASQTALPSAPPQSTALKLPGSTAMAVAGPAVSSQIDDSDPNDPHQQLKHYGKLALDLMGLAGGVGMGMAAIRTNAQSPQKLAAAKGASYLLLGGGKRQWESQMLAHGVTAEEMPKIRAASEKMLAGQLAKAADGMPNTKKLLAHFESGKPEMGWYDDVHQELTHLFGQDANLMGGLLAATSSNATVKSNVALALKAYNYQKIGRSFDNLPKGEGFLPAVVSNIKKVVAGEPIQGRKIDNFAKAIAGDPDAVVVDRWMMRAFGFDKDAPTPHQYDVIEHSVKTLAQQQGVTPRQMQAAIWFSIKQKTEAAAGKVNEAPPYGRILREKLAQQPLPLDAR